LAALVAAVVSPGVAEAKPGCKTKRCRDRVEWRYYKANPMPRCTWFGESGGSYRARNARSTAGGKYQILDGTWYGNGGSQPPRGHRFARWPASVASPLEQERVARRVLRSQGLGAWVLC